MEVKPVIGSRLVDVSYTDPNPGRAQKIANAYADAYMASNVDKRFKANAYAKNFLDDQIKQLKLRMEESERAALEFAEKEKIVEVNDKASVAENNLQAANTALGQLHFRTHQSRAAVAASTEYPGNPPFAVSIEQVHRGTPDAQEGA